MAGNKKNDLDNLAAGFMSTRPPAFDKFLQQTTVTIPTETNSDDQQVNGTSDTPSAVDQVQAGTRLEEVLQKAKEAIGLTDIAEQIESTKASNGDQSESASLTKRAVPTTGKSKKLAGLYEDLFLIKSNQFTSDQRLYINPSHARSLKRLALYCESKNRRVSLQAILDNILHHHFEQYASDIKQIDQQLLRLLNQQMSD
ncbi:DUF3408 domain-containing protein [Spirosoma endophyticum]|uniref:DUF3408 domain-containing protein n=1 Tax=Spirosoma endophyticum TaxID=662367 RepID=A0A1I2BK24_9BACT|nr:DUF3408 domain-containing protein [Spirosoma endophyticum]SFE55623.1 hypothetical protein SAMN05216167_115104 [Spirosoma endophyticum]